MSIPCIKLELKNDRLEEWLANKTDEQKKQIIREAKINSKMPDKVRVGLEEAALMKAFEEGKCQTNTTV